MPTRPFRIAKSPTGFGLFATREIKKKTRIAEYKGPRVPNALAEKMENRGNRYLFEVNSKVTVDGTPRSNVARYFNHSCNPNAEPIIYRKRIFIRSLRRIKPGEEITYHYGMDYLRNVIGISNCKCGRCRRRKARKARERYAAAKRTLARQSGRKPGAKLNGHKPGVVRRSKARKSH
jgi:SET domain-containing protein